jgi:hypothetical protein
MKKKLFAASFVAVLFLFTAGMSYAQISVGVTVDKQNLSLEDNVYLSVTVSGTRSAASEPVVYGGDDFRVVYNGSSSSVSIINGAISSSIDFNYVLVPKKTGTFNIPPVTFRHNDKVYKTKPIKLVVTKPLKKKDAKDIFIEAKVSNAAPYINEQIIFTFKFYSSIQVINATFDSPKFDNFIVEDLGDTKSYQKVINGTRYTINEVKYALFPLKSGEHIIPAVNARADVIYKKKGSKRGINRFFGDPFFRGGDETKTKYLQTKEIKLNVKPLPAAKGKDVPFSNLIGDFKIDASLGKKTLSVGDSTTLTVTVYGYGNIKDGVFPAISDYEDFKVYDDKPVEDIKVTKGGIFGSIALKKAFIPLKEGEMSIPAVRFSYFDTQKGDYVILSTPEYALDVKPSLEKEKLNLVEMVGKTTTKEAVKIIGMDILPVITSLDTLTDEDFQIISAVNALAVVLPGFVYLGFVFYVKRKLKYKADESLLKKKRAFKKFVRSKSDINKLIKNDSNDFYNALLNSFKIYIGDKFNIIGIAMTSKELGVILTGEKLKRDVVASIEDAMEKLERAQFASAKFSIIEKKELFKILISSAKTIEKRVR